MGFTLTIKGQETIYFSENMISSVHVQLSTPHDSKAKSTDHAATLWVTGKLLSTEIGASNSDTLKLFDWSLVPAQSADAYRDVIVKVISADQTFRKIHLPIAFIIDYSERYADNTGVGEFTLVLRQRADQIPLVKATSGGSDDSEE
ncbi:membrane-associated protease 1 [Pelosinus baikalensis]|uniref:Membrane-associated protease 1 n=1 Tax=Pelosinus baikalensis TaxID=2892015 RepID=A0ABS8HYG7_9FIRM|nr:membrane-associated protease 1 [Pelosinus baikalensis]MCC5468213.1 membrane-associated protease 1 [Pelosinus baikalensis]